MDEATLRDIGLTDYEARIYLALLRHAQLSAYALAQKAGLYRQVTYDALNRLVEKGFVSSVKDGRTQVYRATDPSLVMEYLTEKVDRFRSAVPVLQGLSREANNPLVVETYRGANVTRIALRDIVNTLKAGGEVWCTAVDESVPLSRHKTVCEQYERDMLRYGMKERVIIKKGSKRLFTSGTSEYRVVPAKYFNQNPTQIYGDNVQTIVWGNPDYLVIIRSREVADAYRKQFALLWTVAEEEVSRRKL